MSIPETDEINAAIQRAMEGLQPANIDEAQVIIDQVMQRFNDAPVADFCGLSPSNMRDFLYNPFDSPDTVVFSSEVEHADLASFAIMFRLLATAIGPTGLKPTPTGNLPRKVCRDIEKAVSSVEEHDEFVRFGEIQSETDFRELQVVRFVAQSAGLIRKFDGKFVLTKACQKLLAESGLSKIYPKLLRTYATKLAWASWDFEDDLRTIQHSFCFSLFLLAKFGDEWRPTSFYADKIAQAFPHLLTEAEEVSWSTPEKEFRDAYENRMMRRFGKAFGLIETEEDGSKYTRKIVSLRATPLLKEVVEFNVAGQ